MEDVSYLITLRLLEEQKAIECAQMKLNIFNFCQNPKTLNLKKGTKKYYKTFIHAIN